MKRFYENIKKETDNMTEEMYTSIRQSAEEENFNINDLSLQELKDSELTMVTSVIHLIYTELCELSALASLIEYNELKLDEPTLMKDYLKNLNEIATKLVSLTKRSNEILNDKDSNLSNEMKTSLTEATGFYEKINILIHKLTPCFVAAERVERLRKSSMSRKKFVDAVQVHNQNFEESLRNSVGFLVECNRKIVGNHESYAHILNCFVSAKKYFDDSQIEDEQEEINADEPKTINKTSPSVSSSEQARLDMIKKANELYHMVCSDWLRDYDKQIPYGMRQEYETFKNGKFKKFIVSCKMPLAQDATIGMAQNAITQLNGIINNLEDIAERC